jgi:hypothetical protein
MVGWRAFFVGELVESVLVVPKALPDPSTAISQAMSLWMPPM